MTIDTGLFWETDGRIKAHGQAEIHHVIALPGQKRFFSLPLFSNFLRGDNGGVSAAMDGLSWSWLSPSLQLLTASAIRD